MSLTSSLLQRSVGRRINVGNNTTFYQTAYIGAMAMHNVRDGKTLAKYNVLNIRNMTDIATNIDAKSAAISYKTAKGNEQDDAQARNRELSMHPKWRLGDPDSSDRLFDLEKSRGTPNAFIDIHAEILILLLHQLIKTQVTWESDKRIPLRFGVRKGPDGWAQLPTGFTLGLTFLVDLIGSPVIRAIALALKTLIGLGMGIIGLVQLTWNLKAIISARRDGQPFPLSAKKALTWFVPLADAIIKPIGRFAQRNPWTTLFLGLVAIAVVLAFTGGMGAPIAALMANALATFGSSLVAGVGGLQGAINVAFASNWLGVGIAGAKIVSGFVATAIVVAGISVLGYAIRFGKNFVDRRAATDTAQRTNQNVAQTAMQQQRREQKNKFQSDKLPTIEMHSFAQNQPPGEFSLYSEPVSDQSGPPPSSSSGLSLADSEGAAPVTGDAIIDLMTNGDSAVVADALKKMENIVDPPEDSEHSQESRGGPASFSSSSSSHDVEQDNASSSHLTRSRTLTQLNAELRFLAGDAAKKNLDLVGRARQDSLIRLSENLSAKDPSPPEPPSPPPVPEWQAQGWRNPKGKRKLGDTTTWEPPVINLKAQLEEAVENRQSRVLKEPSNPSANPDESSPRGGSTGLKN